MKIKVLAALLTSLFSINVLSHEISQDGDYISALQKYKGNSHIKITLECRAKEKGLDRSRYGRSKIDIKFPLQLKMRMQKTKNSFYKALVGGYEVCPNDNDLDERVCHDWRFDLSGYGSDWVDYLEHNPAIQIQEVSLIDQVRSETGRGFPKYKYSCPLGWDEFGWERCKSTETIYNFDLSWFSKAYKDMTKQCEIHQDKVSSHIKRFLDF